MNPQLVELVAQKHQMSEQAVKDILTDLSQASLYSSKRPDLLTFSPLLDHAVGQLRAGTRVHIYGRPGAGKTAMAASIAGWFASSGKRVLWCDASYSYPDDHILKQTDEKQNISILRSFEKDDLDALIETICLYDLFVLDDTETFDRDQDVVRISTACGRAGVGFILLSQVRKDLWGTKDLVPDLTVTNADLIINITRAEMLDGANCLYRYTAMIKAFRGRILNLNFSFEIDYLGLNLASFVIRRAVECGVMQRRGGLVCYGTETLGFIRQVADAYRHNHLWINEVWNGISQNTRRESCPDVHPVL